MGAVGQGGGLFVAGLVTLSNSTISTNTVRGGDGGDGGPGGIGGNGGDGAAGLAGGVYVSTGVFEVTNCTVAFNAAQASRGGAGGRGGPPGRPGTGQTGQGGGMRNNGGTIDALNTLFGDNTAADFGPDFFGNFATASHNLLTDGTGSNLVNGVNGNLVGSHDMPIDPLLGPLANNGGRTLTHALLPGSPAIDAGDNTGAPMWDQRGPHFYRIENGIIDIGAFEYRPPPQPEPLTEPLSPAATALGPHPAASAWPIPDLLPAPVEQMGQENFVGVRPASSEAASAPLRVATRLADDAYFAALSDPLARVLAIN
jgi:hypothetical protein